MRNHEEYIQDIAQLTDLPVWQVRYLIKLFRQVVGHEIYECIVEDKPNYESRALGLGKLKVEYNNETDDYDVSFSLSREMKKVLDEVLDTQKSPLEDKINKTLVEQIAKKLREVVDLDD